MSSALLIGRNGVGKSTIASILHIFRKIARGANRTRDLVRISDFAFEKSDLPMRFEIEAISNAKNYKYEVALESNTHSDRDS
jgi:predicted ATPase